MVLGDKTKIGQFWKYSDHPQGGRVYYRGELTVNGITTEVFLVPVISDEDTESVLEAYPSI
jgi:hypothetical protein